MNKVITILIFVGMGIYIIFNPKISSSGGNIDLSYMNINILLGFILISFGILQIKSKKNNKESSTDGGTAINPGDSPSVGPSDIDCSVGGGGDGC